jgi:hypothetical protein
MEPDLRAYEGQIVNIEHHLATMQAAVPRGDRVEYSPRLLEDDVLVTVAARQPD